MEDDKLDDRSKGIVARMTDDVTINIAYSRNRASKVEKVSGVIRFFGRAGIGGTAWVPIASYCSSGPRSRCCSSTSVDS